MPPLDAARLWGVQVEAINNLEKSLAADRPRALIRMATGSGKTFTACNFCYRLVKFAGAKRILFLVDRSNLGKQTVNEFQQFLSPHSGYKFTEEFNVQHLRRNSIDSAAKVVITTVQRLFSILKGEEEFDEANEEASGYESADAQQQTPVYVEYNPKLPVETFDFVVVDECHRSIYNLWRDVLLYFDAYLIGLTATPTNQTLGFFRQNLVQDYNHERAVADGVNVGYDVYRIATRVTGAGATLVREPGLFVPRRDRRTRRRRLAELDDDLTYTASQLDRDVVSESQMRLVVRTFRDRLPEIFPDRHKDVPKTLVFAKTDNHAEDLTRIIREEFGRGNEFCQKITSKTTGRKPDDLLSEFRNSYYPRIAVTVDMIATGTDVKPLECLLFMRNVTSASYFEQMKGRGCRVINPDDLRRVTPDAVAKSRYVIVDAVGVCESDKTNSKPMDRQPSVSLDKVLTTVSKGVVNADLVSGLAAKLARLEQVVEPEQDQQVEKLSGVSGGLAALSLNLLQSIDPDALAQQAAAKFNLPPEQEPTEDQLDVVEREAMERAVRPFFKPELRKYLVEIRTVSEQVIDEVTPDVLLRAGFDEQAREKARSILTDFRKFIEENKGEIEALQVLYSRPYKSGLRYRQVKELASRLQVPPFYVDPARPETVGRLWGAYEAVEPAKVKGQGGKALVDLIALVRHALQPDEPLVPVETTVRERYEKWVGDQERVGAVFTPEQRKWLDAIRDHIAKSLAIEDDDLDEVPFLQFGGRTRASQVFGDKLPVILNELNERLAA